MDPHSQWRIPLTEQKYSSVMTDDSRLEHMMPARGDAIKNGIWVETTLNRTSLAACKSTFVKLILFVALVQERVKKELYKAISTLFFLSFLHFITHWK